MKSVFLTLLLLLIAGYLLFVLMLYLNQNKYVFFPPRVSQIDLSPLKNLQVVEVETADKLRLKAYYAAPFRGKPLIIEFHGNASHPAWEIAKFDTLLSQGYGLLLAEYRGYGGNPGQAGEKNFYLDGQAYYDWASEIHEKIILYGASIGSGVAVDVASKNSVAALILEVPFDKLSDVAAWHYPYIPFLEKLMKNKFDNSSKITSVNAPVLYLLARQDAVVPMKFGENLANLTSEPKTVHIFETANHINVYDYEAREIVSKFLKERSK